MRRVVVTGVGTVAPNGIGKDAFWNACCNGRSGVGYIESFDPSNHSVKIAGEVKGFRLEHYLPAELRKSAKIISRAMGFAIGAAQMAVDDSFLDKQNENPERMGVVMGTGIIPINMAEMAPMMQSATENGTLDATSFGDLGGASVMPLWVLKHLPNMVAAHISMVCNAQGPNSTITTACAAGTQAVGEGFRLVARGDADIVLAGGADSRIDPFLFLAYTALGALSAGNRPPHEVSRPFDGQRDGFVMGEGAAVLVLEELERAKRRNAPIYAEVLGMGSSFDAFSVTKPDPSSRGAVRAIRAALQEARVDPNDIDYINAHGTSTRLNDSMETRAVKEVCGDRARYLPLSSIKSMVGHLIGGAGALEAATLALTIQDGVLPPTINLTEPDPDCDLDYVPHCAREIPVKTAVSTSFGFGGQNAALVMRRFSR